MKIIQIKWSQGLWSNPKSAFTLHQAGLLGHIVCTAGHDDFPVTMVHFYSDTPSRPKAALPRPTLFSFQMCCTIAQLALTTGHAGCFPGS